MADVIVNNTSTDTKQLIGQGIRAYIVQDYNSSVAALSRASELLVTEHGDDLHDSLGDVYLYYGKALLGLSREDMKVLGDAVKNKEESDDEEEEEEEEEVENTENEEREEKGKEGSQNEELEEKEKEETDSAKANGTVDSSTENVDAAKNGSAEEKVAMNGIEAENEPTASTAADTSDAKEETDEEPTDLQLAWEVLELAKTIYERRGDDGKKNLAETLVTLGEVSLENSNFDLAVTDMKEGLRIQKESFPKDSRTIAEMYYKLGVVHSTNTEIDQAVECFEQSLHHLKEKVKALEKKEDKNAGDEEEINEIKGLVPDIEEKISDMKSYKDETLKQMMAALTNSKPTSTDGASSSTSTDGPSCKPASDISHLVKRKRKLDEIVEDVEREAEATPAKKLSS